MAHRKNQRNTNGHAGPRDRTNGHAPASTERGGVPVHRDQAASADASETFVAGTAPTAADCASRKACTEAAPPRTQRRKDKGKGANVHEECLARPTDLEALQDSAAFVHAVAARADLVGVSVRLISARDEKIAKAELDRLREMIFGKVGPAVNASDAPTVIWDVPGVNALRNEG